jgi:hypothetical protein
MDTSPENACPTDPLLILQTHAGDLIDRVAEFNCHQYGRADNKIEAEVHNSPDPNILSALRISTQDRKPNSALTGDTPVLKH